MIVIFSFCLAKINMICYNDIMKKICLSFQKFRKVGVLFEQN